MLHIKCFVFDRLLGVQEPSYMASQPNRYNIALNEYCDGF